MEDEDRGPQLASFSVHPRQLDKAKRIIREILRDSDDPEYGSQVLANVPFHLDHGVPLNWVLGRDPQGELVLTIRLKTREVALVEA